MSAKDIEELIEQAGLGLVSWDDVNSAFVDAIPGCFVGMNGQNKKTGASNFVSTAGIPQQSQQDYFNYYSKINPWNPYWHTWAAGQIMRTVAHCPTEQFSNTEFINDWLLPLQKNSIGFGIKLDSTPQDILNLIVHLPGNLPERVEQAGISLLRKNTGNLSRAVQMNRFLADHVGRSVAAAALIERGNSIGFVIDMNLKLVEANIQAEQAFCEGSLVKAQSGGVRFCVETLQQWFFLTVRSLLMGETVQENRRYWRDAAKLWRVQLTRVPEYDPRGGNRFLFPRHYVMALVNEVTRPAGDGADLSMLRVYGLTPAEIRLCHELARGFSIKDAADHLGIAEDTARQRLKAIFGKTGLNRQTDLVLLMARSS